jgi:hypothetical protein
VEQQMGEGLTTQGDRHPFHPGEVTEADLAGLIRQRDHHLRHRAMEGLPMLHPPKQGALEHTPVLIRLLLLQVLQQRGGCQGRIALQQWLQQRFPDLGQWVGTPLTTGLGGFGLEAA